MSKLGNMGIKWTFGMKPEVMNMMIETDPGLSRLDRAYKAVEWNLQQPWNTGEDGVIVPRWAILTLIEASQAEYAAKHERQARQIMGLVGVLLISVAIFGLMFIFGG